MTISRKLSALCLSCALTSALPQESDARENVVTSNINFEGRVNSGDAEVKKMIEPIQLTEKYKVARNDSGKGTSSAGRRKIHGSNKAKHLKKKKPVIGRRVRTNNSNHQSFMPRGQLPGSIRIYGPNR